MKTIQSIELEDEEEKVGKEILELIVEFCLHHHRFKYACDFSFTYFFVSRTHDLLLGIIITIIIAS